MGNLPDIGGLIVVMTVLAIIGLVAAVCGVWWAVAWLIEHIHIV